MSWTKQLTEGAAAYLAARVDGGVWKPTGAYTAADKTPFFIRVVPASPDRIVTVTYYDVTGSGWTSDIVAGLQLRYRTAGQDPRPTDDLGDELRDAFDGLEHIDLGDVRVSLVRWASGATLGQDGNRRWEATQNFHLLTTRPRNNTTD